MTCKEAIKKIKGIIRDDQADISVSVEFDSYPSCTHMPEPDCWIHVFRGNKSWNETHHAPSLSECIEELKLHIAKRKIKAKKQEDQSDKE